MTPTPTTLEDTIQRQTYGNTMSWILGQQLFWVLLAAILFFAYMSFASDAFRSPQNLFNVMRNFAFVGIIALGMTAVVVTGGIDLSVGSVLGLTGMVIGMSMNAGVSFWGGAALALLAGLAVGAFNGVMIAYIKMPAFVVTLGMLSIARSLAMVLSNNRLVFSFGPDQEMLTSLGGGGVAIPIYPYLLPNPVLFLVGLVIVTGFMFTWTRWGRYVFAIGGNEQAATLTGVPVNLVKVSVYMFCSFCAAIVGILEVGWLGSISTSLGQGMELNVIAATVIGGANLMGGIGTAPGAAIGALLLELIRNSLTLLKISPFWQGTFIGTFIIIAVLFDRLRAMRADD